MSHSDNVIELNSIVRDPWHRLRDLTRARIALGRSGSSLPTQAWLEFGMAHALARDAVHLPLDVDALTNTMSEAGLECVRVHSKASSRDAYLKRPDLGRQLADESRAALCAMAKHWDEAPDVVFVIADGLSSLAVERHAVPLLQVISKQLVGWKIGPTVVAVQGRVAIGDPIGAALCAKAIVMLIGERPGLTSSDSLGAYITYAPKIGCSDADRNCVSNIRPEGLGYLSAANKVAYLLNGARRLGASGVQLKDDSVADTQQLAHTIPVATVS